jgi:hypothetical protein
MVSPSNAGRAQSRLKPGLNGYKSKGLNNHSSVFSGATRFGCLFTPSWEWGRVFMSMARRPVEMGNLREPHHVRVVPDRRGSTTQRTRPETRLRIWESVHLGFVQRYW